jgi:hypothetical protein
LWPYRRRHASPPALRGIALPLAVCVIVSQFDLLVIASPLTLRVMAERLGGGARRSSLLLMFWKFCEFCEFPKQWKGSW